MFALFMQTEMHGCENLSYYFTTSIIRLRQGFSKFFVLRPHFENSFSMRPSLWMT